MLARVRVMTGTGAPATAASPSGRIPISSGESRTTKRQSGSMPTSTAAPSTM